MKNSLLKVLAPLLLLSLILAGCGSDDNKKSDQDPPKTESSTPGNETENKDESVKEDQQTADPSTGTEERTPEKELTYTVNGSEKQEKATLKSSDGLSYTIYLLQSYELTAEEPQKDVIFQTEDDEHFMRIERFDAGDAERMITNTKTQLESIGDKVITPTDTNLQVEDAMAFQTESGNDLITAYVFEKEEKPFKFLIFSKKDNDDTDAFLQMAKTILITD